MNEILDVAGALFVFAGSLFCLAAAVGVVRFPDVLTRLHAATKPQVFGLILMLTGVALVIRTWQVALLAALTVMLQVMTAPVASQMLARSAYRTGQWDDEHATVDELAEDLAAAGFVNTDDPDDRGPL